MFAVTAARIDSAHPLSGLELGDRPDPGVPEGWTTVRLKAASLNHHDLWSLRGVGLRADRLPMVLGTDGAGLDEDGNEVVIHAVIGDPDRGGGDETLDPQRSLLSEIHAGTFADVVAVPRRNLLPKPPGMSWAEAACLPTAWLTAYRMLFTKAGVPPGGSVLVQGAGGGVATAAIALARAAGFRVYATSRDEDKRRRALELGAHQALAAGARLPERVDAVLETVGEATWSHSLRSLRPGGTPALVNSIRYAVSHAVGRQAASAHDIPGGLGTRLRRGTATTSANVPAWISESSERCGSRVSSPPPRSGSPITAWMTTSLPSSSSPAPSVPSTIGSRSARSPTPRRLHRSWWLSDAAFSRTVVQPSGTPGSGRSPSSKPDSG